MAKSKQEREESLRELRTKLPPESAVFVIIEAISKTNMTWYARVYCIHKGDLENITFHVAKVLGQPLRDKGGWRCMVGNEVGTSREHEIAHSLSYALHGMVAEPGQSCRPGYTLSGHFI